MTRGDGNRIEYVSGKLVLPGDELCVAEEFMPSEGTYEHEGKVMAMIPGMVLYDYITKSVRVVPKVRRALVPRAGHVVKAYIVSVSEDLAFARIFEIEGSRPLSGTFTGVIHISQVSETYIKTLDEAIRLGDVIRAKVLTSWPPYQLTTKYPGMGVILALCSKCGEPLWCQGSILVCRSCGNRERRKTSPRYLLRLPMRSRSHGAQEEKARVQLQGARASREVH